MVRFFNGKQVSEPGSPIKDIFSPVVNKDGTISLEKSGEENLQEYIDSFRDECDINVILAKYASGDVSVLNMRNGSYGDFTKMPKTYAEMLQLQINSNNYFKSLPKEIREKFNNDANQFFAQSGSQEWIDIMSSMYPEEKKVEDIVLEKEVKE